MGFIGGALGYNVLRWLGGKGDSGRCDGRAYRSRSKLEVLLGPAIWDELGGKVVIDFGRGVGQEAVYVVFGPPWYHLLAGHLFSVFPWAHLLFTEGALIRWRSDFKRDGAKGFNEVEGGLNLMTVRRFERLVQQSRFRFERFETVPIRKLRMFFTPLTREFCTSMVRCTLALR